MKSTSSRSFSLPPGSRAKRRPGLNPRPAGDSIPEISRAAPSARTLKMKIHLLLLAFLPAPQDSAAASRPVRERFESVMEKPAAGGFSGNVLVVKGKELIFEKSYGLADRTKKIAWSRDTVFDIGSITKQFTAAAILKLEMLKKVSTADTLDKYFKNAPADKNKITIHQLLTHTAGFPDEIGGDYEEIGRDPFVARAFATKLIHEPGGKYEYSNVGYSILAAIVEMVSGESYEAFLNKQLFVPAGMLTTGYRIPKWGEGALARGYRKDKDWGTPLDHAWDKDGPYWNLLGNGGILSTTADMLAWHRALLTDKILSADAKKKMYTTHVPEGPEGISYYGYGWSIVPKSPGGMLITHNGGNGFFFADLYRFVDRDLVILIATNASKREYEDLGQELARAALEK